MTSCSALAKEQLERLKAAPFFTIAPTVRNPMLTAGGDVNATVAGYSQFYDADGLPSAANALFETRWLVTDVATAMPLQMIQIQMRWPSRRWDAGSVRRDRRRALHHLSDRQCPLTKESFR